MVSKVDELSAYYAPKEETPESKLDHYPFKVKLLVVACCVVAELIGYAILIVHYDGDCSLNHGSMSCSYAVDKEWDQSVYNQDGLRWIECYDTEGTAKGTSYTDAGNWKDITVCSASKTPTGEVVDDDDSYLPEFCCDGWLYENDCVVDDFCYNTLVMCEWEICPGFWEVFANANGAMTGIHVIFFYVVVTVVVECLVRNRNLDTGVPTGEGAKVAKADPEDNSL